MLAICMIKICCEDGNWDPGGWIGTSGPQNDQDQNNLMTRTVFFTHVNLPVTPIFALSSIQKFLLNVEIVGYVFLHLLFAIQDNLKIYPL